jgi:hypothetical protein
VSPPDADGRLGLAVDVSGERQPGATAHGAALGAAWGLVTGALIAIAVGVADQIILVVLTTIKARKDGPPTAGAG